MTEHDAPSSTTRQGTDVDERARSAALAGFALGLVALMGGGIFATAAQWILLDNVGLAGSHGSLTAALVAGPVCLGTVALGLGLVGTTSQDRLARPVGLAAVMVAVIALLGAVVLVVSSPSG